MSFIYGHIQILSRRMCIGMLFLNILYFNISQT